METEERDVIIIGAGPAGLSAAIFTRLDNWSTLILERKWAGGQGAIAYTVANYPGFLPGDGKVLMENMRKQACSPPPAGTGAELRYEEVLDINPGELAVVTNMNRYRGKAIILATGSRMQTLGIPGEKEFVGKGVSYYAVRDADKFSGKKVLLVGGGNSTAKSALVAIKNKAREVILIHRRESMRAYSAMVRKLIKGGVEIRYNMELKRIEGKGKVEKAVLVDNKTYSEEEMPVDWIVICTGTGPNTILAQKIGLGMTGKFVKVDYYMRTSRKGIFACGELASGHHHLINSAAGGASAGMAVSEFLASESVKKGIMFEGAKNGKYAKEYLEKFS